jgi:SAM-dependent methyltransferase
MLTAAGDTAGAGPLASPGRAFGHHGRVPGIYDEPELYEAACAYRDVPVEVSALLRWSAKHGDGELRSVLELAAGPAEHSRELARRGLDATTLDLSPAMCARARELATATGIGLTVVQADMRDFSIGRQFDLAITMLNSLCHLLTLDDLLQHLSCLARQVAPGGLYIMELAHPADFLAAERRTSSEWSSDVDGGTVSVRWGGGSDEIDPITQVTREHVSVTYRKRGGGVRSVTDVVPNRFWTATELTAAIRLAGGFAVVASYGDFETDSPVEAADAWRMILVLRREDRQDPEDREDREDREDPEDSAADPAPLTAITTPAEQRRGHRRARRGLEQHGGHRGPCPRDGRSLPQREDVHRVDERDRHAERHPERGIGAVGPPASHVGQPAHQDQPGQHDRRGQHQRATRSLAQEDPGRRRDDEHLQVAYYGAEPGADRGDRVAPYDQVRGQEQARQPG